MEEAEPGVVPARNADLYRTRIGLDQTGDNLQQGALSGSILANQSQAFTA